MGAAVLFLRSTAEIVLDIGTGFFDSLSGLIFFLLLGKFFQQKWGMRGATLKKHLKLIDDEDHQEIYKLITKSIQKTHGIKYRFDIKRKKKDCYKAVFFCSKSNLITQLLVVWNYFLVLS